MNGPSVGATYRICIPFGANGSVPMRITDDTIKDLKLVDFRGNFAYPISKCGGGAANKATNIAVAFSFCLLLII